MTTVTLESTMKPKLRSRLSGRSHIWIIFAVGMLLNSPLFSPTASAGDDAAQILKAMSDYLANQKAISLTFDSDVEVVTPEVEKIQFASSGKMLLSRPDKLRVTRTGGDADFANVFVRKKNSAFGQNIKSFSQIATGRSIRPLVRRMREMHIVSAPRA